MFGDILVDKQSLFCDRIRASSVTALPLGFLSSGVSVEFLVLFSVSFKRDGCVCLNELFFTLIYSNKLGYEFTLNTVHNDWIKQNPSYIR